MDLTSWIDGDRSEVVEMRGRHAYPGRDVGTDSDGEAEKRMR